MTKWFKFCHKEPVADLIRLLGIYYTILLPLTAKSQKFGYYILLILLLNFLGARIRVVAGIGTAQYNDAKSQRVNGYTEIGHRGCDPLCV